MIDATVARDAMTREYLENQPLPAVEHVLQHFGRTVGANRILSATVERRSYPLYNLYSGYKEGHPRVTTVFDPTVTIRNMNVDDGMTRWTVTAKGGSSSFVYDPAVTELAQTALERAACEANPHTHWTDERRCTVSSPL